MNESLSTFSFKVGEQQKRQVNFIRKYKYLS